jgi:tRNA (guanine-N7-)-methyltransferase
MHYKTKVRILVRVYYFINFTKNFLVGSKNKLRRFNENETFANVIQPSREDILKETHFLKGNWRSGFFKNDYPIVLELGCGKGEYTVNLAKRNPNKNYIGVDIKGARFWRGAKSALEEDLLNVAFLRIQIELIDHLFEEDEVDEIWITFPDPQIKYKRTKHRLTNIDFLEKYKKILKPNGMVHLKTDSEFMHGYTIGVLQGLGEIIEYAHHDVYGNEHSPQYLGEKKKITYLKFRFRSV